VSITIRCDRCKSALTGTAVHTVLESAALNGWWIGGGSKLCPPCAEREATR
jgi:hypothetical protein